MKSSVVKVLNKSKRKPAQTEIYLKFYLRNACCLDSQRRGENRNTKKDQLDQL